MKAICVYCGSSPGRLADYAKGARALGQALLAQGLGLVYGGASIGLMGLVANTVLAGGGRVVGVIPQALACQEVAHAGLTELIVTQNMHERKTRMAELSDGFIALPGGIGTFEELFEIWTWAQLGIHAKPVGLLNVAGYYDGLVSFLDHATQAQFLKPQHRAALLVEQDPVLLLQRFAAQASAQVSGGAAVLNIHQV
ncbi:TIGR00730 family Rossman fold protein [Rhodoferax sp.]|uniref:LOG family protein n=1 Tax=Rhodoferax sp. TaxID=50421 RepID=UPI002617F77B|nr:TIGR00730 family Rossman fold protein [Rhodoferax sp.]MDD2808020.1 TIGR00730 family Rossman fold protein [Rhodoferax sp.]MDD4942055.1 TIGR00730 family Rossman fold protein [Rhodoferax sp.]MDD5478523.1 TIGR00730 family Rossman fold protein [Rhodoferax sp.]